MDDRGYVAQALFDRLGAEGVAFRVLGDATRYPESAPAEVQLAVSRAAFRELPRLAARFCQEFDLQLVQLERPEQRAWRFVLAWSDDVGRPRFLSARALRDEELLAGAPAALFAHGLLEAIERPQLLGEWLGELWRQDPWAAAGRLRRHWRDGADRQLIAQAVASGDWAPLRAALPRLRRALRRRALPGLRSLGARAARVVFTGREGSRRSSVMLQVARELAPLGLRIFEERPGATRRADFRVVLDAPGALAGGLDDAAAIGPGQAPAAIAAEAERAILRWLECRVERRFPDAVVGENPLAARLLQLAVRKRIWGMAELLSMVLNCSISCPIRSPILMPYPYGIVIEAGAVIGSRVTVMQQASLHGTPVIEDHVCIGPGARIAGALRIGRGATVGANAVVTRDVPSHCTVVGANRILGVEPPAVAAQRLADHEAVVNT